MFYKNSMLLPVTQRREERVSRLRQTSAPLGSVYSKRLIQLFCIILKHNPCLSKVLVAIRLTIPWEVWIRWRYSRQRELP